MLSLSKITLYLGKEKPKLSVNNLELQNGLWALVGRNGSGKSTFLNAISGVNENFEGSIFFNEQNKSSYSAQALAKIISVVFSKTELFGNHKALDVLYLGRIPYQSIIGGIGEADKLKVNEVIELLQLESLLQKPFSVLSDGEKQLVMIGRALVQDTDIILLDEPTAFLDVVNRKKITNILAKIAKKKLVIFSTHNLDLVEQFCDGVLLISNNQLVMVDSKTQFQVEFNKLFEHEV